MTAKEARIHDMKPVNKNLKHTNLGEYWPTKMAQTTLDKIFDEIEECVEKHERILRKDKRKTGSE